MELLETCNELIKTHLELSCIAPGLIEPIKYVLTGGKRIRPMISLDIYNTKAAAGGVTGICFLSTEYLHSASLIIDDLPCMDNAQTRRGNDCIHLRYSEAIAQLTTAALLALCTHSLGYDLNKAVDSGVISKATATEITMYALRILGTSLLTVTEGQLLDIASTDIASTDIASTDIASTDIGNVIKSASEHFDVNDIIIKKTGTLFQMCFELGWILGTGSVDGTEKVRDLANLFAMAFQIADDIEDMSIDLQTNKKNVNQNYALAYGRETAVKDGNTFLDKFVVLLDEMQLSSPFFHQLVSHLRSKLV